MSSVTVNLGSRTYSIRIGPGILANAGKYISALDIGMNGIVITNDRVKHLYGGILRKSLSKSGMEARVITVPDSESSKSYKVFSRIIRNIASLDKGRKPFIIALGGGVIGDLAGFVAAAYRRGVPFVQIPTTLLAQVDSSVGGKVAIDLPVAKNLVGAFYQPSIVISDTSLLETLPLRQIRSGLSEIIKYSIIHSKAFFDFLSRNIASIKKLHSRNMEYIVRRCCAIKSEIVSADEDDTNGLRAILNYGHTIGHAIEAASGYTGRYNHGEAVAIGMASEADLSNKIGILSANDLARIKGIIVRAGLSTTTKKLKAKSIFEALTHDKKFTGGVNRFALPVRLGRARIVENIPEDLITDAISRAASR